MQGILDYLEGLTNRQDSVQAEEKVEVKGSALRNRPILNGKRVKQGEGGIMQTFVEIKAEEIANTITTISKDSVITIIKG